MKVVYSNHPIEIHKNSIFLAGPTPRSKKVASWRPEAFRSMRDYEGLVYVPEWDDNAPKIDYLEQVEWEYAHLENCGVIVFWVPRNLETMPAFTTNVEFGSYVRSGRVLYGRPDDSPNNRYLDWLYEKVTKKEPYNSLDALVSHATFLAENS